VEISDNRENMDHPMGYLYVGALHAMPLRGDQRFLPDKHVVEQFYNPVI